MTNITNSALFAVAIAGLLGLALLFSGPPGGDQVSFAFKNLPDLPRGFVYEAWVIDEDDALVSLGRFGQLGNAKNFRYFGDLHRQNRFLISLETGDTDRTGDLNGPDPDLILFAGRINTLEDIVHLSLIAPDLETPSGGLYVLNTPTDDSVNPQTKLKDGVSYNDNNEEQGIWFVSFDPETNGLTPIGGLMLPRIPSENFSYQGWVVEPNSDTYVTTGRFSEPSIPDWNSGQSIYDGGKVHLGPLAPGEDFVNPGVGVGLTELPLNLNQGWVASISIEPHSDTDEMPFVLVPWSTRELIGTGSSCYQDTVISQPSPKEYQQQRCLVEPRYDGVAVIH